VHKRWSVRCCNKLPENNVDFATGPYDVKIGPDRYME